MTRSKMLLAIPTFNEAENLPLLLKEVLAQNLDLDILVIDDGSPDGTGRVADEFAAQNPRIKVLHRTGKLGIGSAHLTGIDYAYRLGYPILVTMDADFSHKPSDIASFLAQSDTHDIVVGTRFSREQSLKDWTWFRRGMTHLGHFLTKWLLRLPYDATGGFRVYRLDHIPQVYFDLVTAQDYEFFFESLAILHINGFPIAEVPIDLPSRAYGHSKMQLRHIIKGVTRLTSMALTMLTARKRLYRPDLRADGYDSATVRDEWDAYWDGKKQKAERSFYDVIARFYRYRIITPSLNRIIQAQFPPGAALLHAGCGSGEVDVDVVRYGKVTALDISPKAIERYGKLHEGHCTTVLGSIFEIPYPDASFDGVYNLGVMEHFDENHLQAVLTEMHRVLKPGGKVVLFWPPVYGLSVIALHAIHFVLNTILRRNVRLHPAEPTKVSSANRARGWLQSAGLEFQQLIFGPRDLFTYAVLIGVKHPTVASADRSKAMQVSLPAASPS